MCARGRPHGAAPTNPNERSGWTETPHPSRPSAVPPSPEGESSARRVVAPHEKRLPPSRGKLSSEARLMRVPTGMMYLSSPPHPALRATFPPVGGRLCGRPHGAAPTNPNGRGGWTETPHPSRPSAVPPCPTPFVPSGHFPIPSVAARHLPLTRGVGPLTGGVGPIAPRAAESPRPFGPPL